jgi:hypothetical protein
MSYNLPKEVPVLDPDSPDFKENFDFQLWSTQSCSDYRNDRERPYNGQPWTDDGVRGQQEVKGLTMRDIKDCLIKAMLISSKPPQEYWDRFSEFFNNPELLKEEQDKFVHTKVELGTWRPQDVYKIDWNNIDPIAITQNLTVEIEKMMGIFPNIPKSKDETNG